MKCGGDFDACKNWVPHANCFKKKNAKIIFGEKAKMACKDFVHFCNPPPLPLSLFVYIFLHCVFFLSLSFPIIYSFVQPSIPTCTHTHTHTSESSHTTTKGGGGSSNFSFCQEMLMKKGGIYSQTRKTFHFFFVEFPLGETELEGKNIQLCRKKITDS